MITKIKRISLLLLSVMLVMPAFSQEKLGYQKPPAEIAKLVEAPSTPLVSFTENGDWMLLMGRPGYGSIEDLAQDELRIAGMRINPATSGPSRSSGMNSLTLKNTTSGEEFPFTGLPSNPKISNVSWSPDESKIAFAHTTDSEIQLWLADVATRRAARVGQFKLVDVMGSTITWMPDSKNMIVMTVPANRGGYPQAPKVPAGPIIQATSGDAAPSRTYQDLLQNSYDETLFAYFATSSLMKISVDGNATSLNMEGLFKSYSLSPDGNYIKVETIQRPFSYLVPANSFPYDVDIHDVSGKHIKKIASIPLDENRPTGFDATVDQPRSFNWRADANALLYWVEAQDGGDPRKDVAVRDIVFALEAPFTGEKKAIAKTSLRYGGISWGDNNFALLSERWRATRTELTSIFDPSDPNKPLKELIRRSYDDIYNDPGSPITVRNEAGRRVLLREGNKLFMTSTGGSPEGDMPFFSSFDVTTKQQEILWRCEAPYYERITKVVDLAKMHVITMRESENDVPNYQLRDLKANTIKPITAFPHPTPELLGIQKELVKYKRADGVDLSAVLYTPQGYDKDKDGPLPVLMWAYPREYKSADVASQVRGSQYTFTRLSWGSPLYWVLRGYAIMDQTEMPIVGEGDTEPNDVFVQQLVANAEAAINKVVDMGVGDRNRIGVGGHSYGAFMTANLLAHTDLFAAGIARSGAYNRTLTPFGFQAEERTYWEAPEVYNTMSPFMNANKVDQPLLLIHGEADNNSGTFPIQSERFYNALKGHGATTRLVMLPHESHGYAAKESILHTLYEMDSWLEEHVKNAPTKPNQATLPNK